MRIDPTYNPFTAAIVGAVFMVAGLLLLGFSMLTSIAPFD